jgi:hypothetical protein
MSLWLSCWPGGRISSRIPHAREPGRLIWMLKAHRESKSVFSSPHRCGRIMRSAPPTCRGTGTNRGHYPDLAIQGNERRPRTASEGPGPGPGLPPFLDAVGPWLVAVDWCKLAVLGTGGRLVAPTCSLSDFVVEGVGGGQHKPPNSGTQLGVGRQIWYSLDPHALLSVSVSPLCWARTVNQHRSSHQVTLCGEIRHMIYARALVFEKSRDTSPWDK